MTFSECILIVSFWMFSTITLTWMATALLKDILIMVRERKEDFELVPSTYYLLSSGSILFINQVCQKGYHFKEECGDLLFGLEVSYYLDGSKNAALRQDLRKFLRKNSAEQINAAEASHRLKEIEQRKV